MRKNNSYKVLKSQVFHLGKYSLVPIRFKDRLSIMKWRNEQLYHLRQEKPLTKKDQDDYFIKVVNKLFIEDKPKQILFSYLENDVCIGYGGLVHINWVDKNAELSFIMNTQLEKECFHKHWSNYLYLIEKVAFDDLNLHKIYTYAFDIRPHLYIVLEKNGFLKESTLKEHCFFEDKFIDIIIHSKIKNADELSMRKVVKSDERIIFNWANEDLVRKQSYNSSKISFEEHKKWFSNKLIDELSLLLIVEKKSEQVGLIRFEIKDNFAVIGVLIDKKYRGKGLSVKSLKLACKVFYKKYKLPILAYIKKENIASIKAFEKAGFKFQQEKNIQNIPSFVYQLNAYE